MATSDEHLRACLAAARARVVEAVATKRTQSAAPHDPLRGLYVSDADLDALLEGDGLTGWPATTGNGTVAAAGALADQLGATADAAGIDLPLRRLPLAFELQPLDVELLLLALLPDVDPGAETLFAFLQDDVGRRRPSVRLALALCGAEPLDPGPLSRLLDGAPLIDGGLVTLERGAEPLAGRELRVPDRVVLRLLGDDAPDPTLAGVIVQPGPALSGDPKAVARSLRAGTTLIYLHEQPAASGKAVADAAYAELGIGTLCLDLASLAADVDLAAVARAALRDVRLLGRGLIVGPVERLAGDRDGPVGVVPTASPGLRVLADAAWPVILTGQRSWDPAWSRTVPLVIDVPTPPANVLGDAWRALTDGLVTQTVDPLRETAAFRLDVDQVQRAVTAAWRRAELRGDAVSGDDLRAGARAQNAAGLERLATRIEPSARWDDLVLPPDVARLLRELVERAELRGRVLDEWGLRRGGRRGEGITALFGGPPGTGKTMAAEVVACQLGLDLYTVDLSSVVDKYIGETEKNLDRIFTEAQQVNGVLLFDEADALFGKRSDVADAHDRYANVETAYLLQRMEAFDGIAVLATNLRSNLDEAFARRLDTIIDFPFPEADQRLLLWQHALPREVPVEDLDLGFCAQAFPLSGGNIRNIVVTAAFFAAADPEAPGVRMVHVIRAVEREYAKLGRMCVAEEFGPYHELVASS